MSVKRSMPKAKADEKDQLCRSAFLQEIGIVPVASEDSGKMWRSAADDGSAWANMKITEECWKSHERAESLRGDEYAAKAINLDAMAPTMKLETFKAHRTVVDKARANNVILVVDDNQDMADLTAKSLEDSKFKIMVAYTPRKAIEMVKSEKRLFAVVLDYEMPEANGIQLLQTFKKHKLVSDSAATVMVSAHGDPDLIRQGVKLGVKRWVVKPFDPDDLKTLLSKIHVGARL